MATSIELLREVLHHQVGADYHPERIRRLHHVARKLDQLVVAYMRMTSEDLTED